MKKKYFLALTLVFGGLFSLNSYANEGAETLETCKGINERGREERLFQVHTYIDKYDNDNQKTKLLWSLGDGDITCTSFFKIAEEPHRFADYKSRCGVTVRINANNSVQVSGGKVGNRSFTKISCVARDF